MATIARVFPAEPSPFLLPASKNAQHNDSHIRHLSRALSMSSGSLESIAKELDIPSFTPYDQVQGQEILDYLENNPQVQGLRCQQVLSDEHVAAIRDQLVDQHTNIHWITLDLPDNNLSPVSAKAVADILRIQAETMQHLDVSENPAWTAVGVSALVEPLTSLSHPSRLRVLKLNHVGLSGTKGATAIASILRDNQCLEELYLARNKLGGLGVSRLAAELKNNDTLVRLDVSSNQIKAKGMTALAEALRTSTESNLQILDISNNDIKAGGISSLVKLLAEDRRITVLYCNNNGLGPEGVSQLGNALQINYTLEDLRLENNQIGDSGAWMLMEGLMDNEHRTCAIERLHLGWNGIGLEGVSCLAEALRSNTRLSHIDMTGNLIDDMGAEVLAESLSYHISIDRLQLSDNSIQTPGAMALAAAMAKPTCSLSQLVCDNNPIGDEGLMALQRVPQLRRNQTVWLAALLRDIAKRTTQSIRLSDATASIGDEELVLITQEILQESTPCHLQTFWLSGRSMSRRSLIPWSLHALKPPLHIVRIYVSKCSCGNEMAENLGEALRDNPSLQVLSLTESNVETSGASAIAQGLMKNTTLRRLNLDRNQIGDDGMGALALTLASHHSAGTKSVWMSLSASRNGLSDACMGKAGLQYLQELTLGANEISDRGALEFCGFLMDDCLLKHIGLRQTLVTERGGSTLQTFLSSDAVVEYDKKR
eukprot:Nitzschia sp. Nitz4//scaffold17_size182527//56450//58579//NITZ4_001843-RA/size182527-processed-gene-0.10-mRNA-1//1//CDS//3329539307//6783//frame0